MARDFFVRQFKVLKGYIYMPRGLWAAQRKTSQNLHLTRDFFVRQFKVLKGYIIICRDGFGLYNGKRSETYILARDFFARQFKDSAADMNIGKEALGCITEKDPSKKSKRQRRDTIKRSNLYLLRFTLKRLMRPS